MLWRSIVRSEEPCRRPPLRPSAVHGLMVKSKEENRAWINFQKRGCTVYSVNQMWSRKFWPVVPEVQETLRRAIQTIRYDYDPAIHIPREAGCVSDSRWPLTRKCARSFHMIGYCHVIAVVMLDLAQRALPEHDWCLVNAEKHSVVTSRKGVIIDIITSHASTQGTLERVRRDCLDAPCSIWSNVDEYIEDHLKMQPFGPPTPMPKHIQERLGQPYDSEARVITLKPPLRFRPLGEQLD